MAVFALVSGGRRVRRSLFRRSYGGLSASFGGVFWWCHEEEEDEVAEDEVEENEEEEEEEPSFGGVMPRCRLTPTSVAQMDG